MAGSKSVLRSPASVLDFLGAVVRAQQRTEMYVERPLFVVVPYRANMPVIASVKLGDVYYAIPSGEAGGASGETLTFVSRLIAEASSVRDLPPSTAVTFLRE